jgi:hypothetical protein
VTNFHGNCAQILKNDAPASHNRLSHGVLRTWTIVCSSFWSQKPMRSLYFVPWWYGRFHYSRSLWRWCCSNSRDDRIFQSPTNSPEFRLVITSSPVSLPSIHLTQLYQTNSFAPLTTSMIPRTKFVVCPVSIMMLLKHLIRTWLRYLSMFRLCHKSLRINRCFYLIASVISFLKSLSPDLLCLL